jgi:hypothetical protein
VFTVSMSRSLSIFMSVGPRQMVSLSVATLQTRAAVRVQWLKLVGQPEVPYRFQILLTIAVSFAYGDKPVYIYGVSSVGLSNNALANGRHFRIPAPVTIKTLEFLEL